MYKSGQRALNLRDKLKTENKEHGLKNPPTSKNFNDYKIPKKSIKGKNDKKETYLATRSVGRGLKRIQGNKDKMQESEIDENRCWKGYKPVKGKKPYSKGSCIKQ